MNLSTNSNMWSDFFHCKEQALVTVYLFLWNANQASSEVAEKCSDVQFPPNCPVSPCPRCVGVSLLSREPYVFKQGNSTEGFLHGK